MSPKRRPPCPLNFPVLCSHESKKFAESTIEYLEVIDKIDKKDAEKKMEIFLSDTNPTIREKAIELIMQSDYPSLVRSLFKNPHYEECIGAIIKSMKFVSEVLDEAFYQIAVDPELSTFQHITALRALSYMRSTKSLLYLLKAVKNGHGFTTKNLAARLLRFRGDEKIISEKNEEYRSAKNQICQNLKKMLSIYQKISQREHWLNNIFENICFGHLESYLSLLYLVENREQLQHIEFYLYKDDPKLRANSMELLNLLLKKDRLIDIDELTLLFFPPTEKNNAKRNPISKQDIEILIQDGDLEEKLAGYFLAEGSFTSCTFEDFTMKDDISDYIEHLTTIETLEKIDIFSEASAGTLHSLASISKFITVEKNTQLFKMGEESDCLYFICEGEITIFIGNAEIAKLQSGEVIGDLGLITDDERSADALATEESRLLVIDKKSFQYIITVDPEVSLSLLKVLAKRIKNMMRFIK